MTNFTHLKNFSYELKNDIAWLTLDRHDSSVNSLNEEILLELESLIDHVKNLPRDIIKGMIISSAKKSGFIAGADISQFKNISDPIMATDLIRKGQLIFDKLAQLSINTVALISGFCLGGGLELALACRYRIAQDDDKTKLGLPEVKLGIHPGWGGTVRLPALIGATNAMDLILSGRSLSAKSAKKMGLVDQAVPKRIIMNVAIDYALNAKPMQKPTWLLQRTNDDWVRPLLSKVFYKQLNKKITRLHYPAPYEVVDNWVKNGVSDPKAQLGEAQSIGRLLCSSTSQNLVGVFFLSEKLKALAKDCKRSFKHVHVIGAGVMGGDIAAWCALRGLRVTLQDQSPEFIGSAIKRAYDLAKKKAKEPHKVQAIMDRLIPDVAGLGIKHADVIIEAITEKLEAKISVFQRLEKEAKPNAILATNTSTIPLEEICAHLQDPSRLVGIHFFNPVPLMPLVEVVVGAKTNAQVKTDAMGFVKAIDKLPLPVKSAPGFLVNRILLPYMLEALALLEEGVSGPAIDKVAVEFGMPMGPIELADTVGLDVCMHALESFLKMSGGGSIPGRLQELVNEKRLGKKTGQGFYKYNEKGKVQKEPVSSSEKIPSDIIDRLILRMVNESVACLREGIVASPDLLDAGAIFGIGFPPFRGGPMAYVQKEGFVYLKQQLSKLHTRYGDRFLADIGWQEERVA